MSIQYQRNQVETAIARTIDPRSVKRAARIDEDCSAYIRSRIKRLLDADRNLPVKGQHAFYSTIKPGTGNVNGFSYLDAYMLMLGICLNGHFWPQNTVVGVLRRARSAVKRELEKIFDPSGELADQALASKRNDNANDPDLKYFIVATDGGRSDIDDVMFRISDPEEALRFQIEKAGRATTGLAFNQPAHDLREHLSSIEPAKRGRT